MQEYRVIKMNCTLEMRNHLQAIGISEGATFKRIPDAKTKNICMLLVDESTFCIREELFNTLELEEIPCDIY